MVSNYILSLTSVWTCRTGRKDGKEHKEMKTSEADRCFEFKLNKDSIKIHFGHDYMPEPDNRRFATCIIETERHEFYSGIAMNHPKEHFDTKTGWKISLKRACDAMNWVFGESYYKHFWHEIRSQLRDERITENLKKALEEENGQNAS